MPANSRFKAFGVSLHPDDFLQDAAVGAPLAQATGLSP
jgi:hypothetical protein